MLKQDNRAENHLVVGSLEVLGEMKSGNIAGIYRQMDTLVNSQNTIREQQEQYWKELSDDGIISPLEKKILRKEWEEIEQTHTAVNSLADEKGFSDSPGITEYNNAFNRLEEFLFGTLRLFDDMRVSTEIPDRTAFDRMFQTYYGAEAYAQGIMTGTFPGFYSMRLSAGQVKQDKAGDYSPETIAVEKLCRYTYGESPTNYGTVKARVLPQDTELDAGNWYPVEEDGEYTEGRIYGVKVTPFYLLANGLPLLADGDNIGILYRRV